MASRSRRDRPFRRALRFVSRLLPRSLRPGLTGSSRRGGGSGIGHGVGVGNATGAVGSVVGRGAGPFVGAGVADGLPVRAPWSILRWYRALRPGSAQSGGSPGVDAGRVARGPAPGSVGRRSLRGRTQPRTPAARDNTPGGRAWNVPEGTPAVGGSARRLTVARTPLTTAASLIGETPAGPDVRPGNELAMGPGLGSLLGPAGSAVGADERATSRGGGANVGGPANIGGSVTRSGPATRSSSATRSGSATGGGRVIGSGPGSAGGPAGGSGPASIGGTGSVGGVGSVGGAGIVGGGAAGGGTTPGPGDVSRRSLASAATGEPAPVVGAGLADGLPVRGGITIVAGSAGGSGQATSGDQAAGQRSAQGSSSASGSRAPGSGGWGPGVLGRARLGGSAGGDLGGVSAGRRGRAGQGGPAGAGAHDVSSRHLGRGGPIGAGALDASSRHAGRGGPGEPGGPAGAGTSGGRGLGAGVTGGRVLGAGVMGRRGPGAGAAGGPGAGAAGGLGASLLRRPVDGPTVSDPDGAGGMRVLGAATLPPGNVPDPTGAVSIGPAAGHHVGASTQPGGAGGDRARGNAGVSRLGATPRERWEAAVAARPLETPRPLPVAFHAMATTITGRARPPLFTTGPRTRSALAAAGAHGATTGTVVHLPAAPTPGPAVSAVLAHELTHTKSPVRRPRFFLSGASGLLDDDERQALAAGQERLGQATTTGAGIVDSLPVGGGGMGAVSEVATRAARAAVIEASGSPMGSAFSGMQSAAGDAFSGLQGMAGNAMSGLQGAAGNAMSGLQGGAGDAAEGAAAAAGDVAGGVSNAVGGAAQAAGAAMAGAAGAAKPLDPDQVVEIVERRLLREIERRGGRWAGIF